MNVAKRKLNLTLEEFTFINVAKKYGLSPETKAVYKSNKSGNNVFIKTSRRRKKLLYEYNAHNLFFKKANKNNGVIIPEPLKLYENNGQYVFIMENLELNPVHHMTTNLKIKYYLNVLKALKEINNKDNVNTGLKVYSPIYIFLTVPYFVLVAVLRGINPVLLLNSWIKIFKYLPDWLKLKPEFICHGDLHATNILGSGKKTALIDFGEALLSHKFYDLAIAANTCWRTPDFCQKFMKTLLNNNLIMKEELSVFYSFVVYNLIQRLSGEVKKTQKYFYINRLININKQI